MILYFKNNITNQIQSYNIDSLSRLCASLRTDPWEQIQEPQDITLDSIKKEKEKFLKNLVSVEISKPLFCKNIDGEACYILTGKKSKFIGCESLAENETRYFKAVDENGARLSYDLKLNSAELQELSRHYREREDTAEELQEGYIDQIDAATTVEELNNINFEELE
jgi:hypothetical protein